jgi:hypothetical protein
MRLLLVQVVLMTMLLSPASFAGDAPPRVIARFDVALLAIPNGGAQGGGGISLPVDGTGAGLDGAGGMELGAEVRLSRWIAFDASAGWYRPDLQVGRDQGPDTMIDVRSAAVDLRTVRFGLVITPPKWRSEWARAAFGALLSRAEISEVPSSLGIVVDESDTGIGVDFRADFLFSKNRHWGIGVALSFESLGPGFVDVETGARGSLQVSGMFLRVGVRGAW